MILQFHPRHVMPMPRVKLKHLYLQRDLYSPQNKKSKKQQQSTHEQLLL